MYAYRVADHEFGHVLGLPDEYQCYDSLPPSAPAAIRNSQNRFRELCPAANVPVPEIATEGRNVFNSSIMSAGTEVLKAHYTTLWKALCDLTGSNAWTIE
jgi:hypothetical protein